MNVKIDELREMLDETYFEDNWGDGSSERAVLKAEFTRMIPFNELNITERTSELQMVQKQIDVVLTKNANNHSSDFVEGMEYVNGVINDLARSKEIV